MPPSPMMQQYQEARSLAGDALLLFRMGDFYELFFEDAKIAARILGIALTSRDKGENPVPMAGFPYHQLDPYLAKIIAAGHRAAICEQVEDPKQAKGLVKRELTRIVTPGTLTDEALLDPQTSNFLAAIAHPVVRNRSEEALAGLAWIDISTGRFCAASLPTEQIEDHLARIAPAELLVSTDASSPPPSWRERTVVTDRPAWTFGFKAALESIGKQFGPHALAGFGFDSDSAADSAAIRAAGAILEYLVETQKASLLHIDSISPYPCDESLAIDPATRRSLELVATIRDGKREGSLLGSIDRTVTCLGARLLADWLAAPLTDVAKIDARMDAVAELVADATLTASLRESLKQIFDIQRLLARVTTGRASPRDLSYLGRTLACLPKLKAKLTGRSSRLLQSLETRLDLCADIRAPLEQALVEDCPLTSREGGFIRDGYRRDLDELRELSAGGKQWMANYQASEAKRTGIPSIKVGFNSVFGYFLEVTHAHREKIPAEYIRKQTLKNAERYVTPELKEYEEKVLSAEQKSKDIETDVFTQLRELVCNAAVRLQGTSSALAELDVLAALAELARSRGYVRPKIVDDPVLHIEGGRHPVLDITEPEGTFVPNSIDCAPIDLPKSETSNGAATKAENDPLVGPGTAGSVLLITGPNMAGKSTYIRQAALLTLLAQIGSFVPARRATIGVADRIFARVGASDELSRGQSTFMVEMTETARILNTATRRSLVVLDEIGRGTSTYDGLSLAWSIVEYIHDAIGCRTLFATHYHELTELSDRLPGVRNYNVSVKEWEDEVVFLHQIVPGAADKSYGIHVAKLAGVPGVVNERAREVLRHLESQHGADDDRRKSSAGQSADGRASKNGHWQMSLFGLEEHPLLDEIRALDLNALTPFEALQCIHKWQTTLVGERKSAEPLSR